MGFATQHFGLSSIDTIFVKRENEAQAFSLKENAAGMEEFSATVIQAAENTSTVAQACKSFKRFCCKR